MLFLCDAVFSGHEYSSSIDHLGRELFDILWAGLVLVERWRQTSNRIRPHSTVGYRSPAPEPIALRCG